MLWVSCVLSNAFLFSVCSRRRLLLVVLLEICKEFVLFFGCVRIISPSPCPPIIYKHLCICMYGCLLECSMIYHSGGLLLPFLVLSVCFLSLSQGSLTGLRSFGF